MNPIVAIRATPLLLVLLLAACASGGGSSGATPEEQVMKRAGERWQYLIDGQPDRAWDYLSKGVQSTESRDAYARGMKERPVHWLAVEPLEAECEPARCDVRIKLEYEITIPGGGAGPTRAPAWIYERWILQGQAWVHVPKDFL
jgi:hypothetical protein